MRTKFIAAGILAGLSGTAVSVTASAQTFTEIAGPATGLTFERVPSPRHQDALQIYAASQQTPLTMMQLPGLPTRTRGLPGTALFDFDGDGDLDIFVTNGPGAPNSLYSSQLNETGDMTFVDVAAAAGVNTTSLDAAGTCFGDIDNDGDVDLMVVANDGPHVLFENNGDGTFDDISVSLPSGGVSGVSCAMGDIDNDGLLDIAVTHTFSYDSMLAIFVEPYAFNEHNELFHNDGGNTFTDVSASSGILEGAGLPPGAASISWALAFEDYDQDGDVDLIVANDQGALPSFVTQRGVIQVFDNDGTGQFTAIGDILGTHSGPGSWMGLSFADFNNDGNLDMFASNFGDYFLPLMGIPYNLGEQQTRWFLGQDDTSFTDPGVGPSLVASAFGWGTSSQDYDNDGDTDILYHGGLDMHVLVDCSNAGTLLVNDGDANFTLAQGAFQTNHARRNVQGAASGDLNNDGFIDIVSVSNEDFPAPIPLVPYPAAGVAYGSPHDATASFVPTFAQPNPGEFVWTGLQFPNGGISVELNNGDSGNSSITVAVMGSIGITSDGGVNRSGIGAIVSATPRHGSTQMKPVLGGGSYLSQDSLAQSFGLGDARRASVDVQWPGGVLNRLYAVKKNRSVTFPEIPCSIDDQSSSFGQYLSCVATSLNELKNASVISRREKGRLFASAIIGWIDEH